MDALPPVPGPTQPQSVPAKPPKKYRKGQFLPGVSGNPGGSPGRARQALNADTIREMHLAFNRGGRKAIDMVMKHKPDVFLKLLVLLVPRELEVSHKGGVKAMTDEQLEQGIEAIRAMLAARADGSQAQVIEGVVEPAVTPDLRTLPNAKARKRGRDDATATSDASDMDATQPNNTNDINGLDKVDG